jgi:hypothetical protein
MNNTSRTFCALIGNDVDGRKLPDGFTPVVEASSLDEAREVFGQRLGRFGLNADAAKSCSFVETTRAQL